MLKLPNMGKWNRLAMLAMAITPQVSPASASLVLLLGVRPLMLNAGQLAALIEYISSIRIVDSCSCIAECSCSLLTGSGCSLLTGSGRSLLTEHSCSHLSDWG